MKSHGNNIKAPLNYSSSGLRLYTDLPISYNATLYRTLKPPFTYKKARFAIKDESYYVKILVKKPGTLGTYSS